MTVLLRACRQKKVFFSKITPDLQNDVKIKMNVFEKPACPSKRKDVFLNPWKATEKIFFFTYGEKRCWGHPPLLLVDQFFSLKKKSCCKSDVICFSFGIALSYSKP